MPSNPGGAALLEREPFLFKHPATAGQSGPFTHHTSFPKESSSMHTIVMHSIVLPPRLVAPTLPSFSTDREIGAVSSSRTPGVTRLGHRFRASAHVFIPSVALHVMLEDNDSSDSSENDTNMENSPPPAPKKGPVPFNRLQTPTPSTSVAPTPSPIAPASPAADVVESIPPLVPVVQRRS